MISPSDKLYADFEAVNRIPVVQMMLEVICRTTGMGFAAVARVTEDRWLACCVRDEVNFGLVAGEELEIKTTICDEIRDSHKPVIIDHVAMDASYVNHHTPKLYGLQSYISFPIILKTGEFFGTLCAIDARPAHVSDPATTGTFTLFAELLSFHLGTMDLIERSKAALEESNRQLTYYQDESRQYRHISNHTLQEPLRKIRLFSDFLVTKTAIDDLDNAKQIALKINSFALDITKMIQDLADFSRLPTEGRDLEAVDLNKTLLYVCSQLDERLNAAQAVLENGFLPTIPAIPVQMAQLFYHLIGNAVQFSKAGVAPVIKIYSKNLDPDLVVDPALAKAGLRFCEVVVEDNGIGIEQGQLEKIYDIFVRGTAERVSDGFGAGLAHCRKIVHNHGGTITARSILGEGSAFSIILPV
jgi:signal transduction histidine kinase